ncbi:MAG TPA: SDR family oxidoreductase [Gemmatimonadaceae bacterium]|jgi:NADP-dependent 3-hydroxy acid dehydrogenase YdfG|nr:SDR family oxidoreductase [Gemmatimonadaceae bacterium]
MTRSRTALVTGASRGIGLAVAKALASGGWRVGLVARGAEALDDAARVVGGDASSMACDLSDERALRSLVDRAGESFGGAPDVLVNSAGVFALAPAHLADAADFERALEVNLVGPFRLVRAFLPAMRERRSGHVVSIGSVADHVALPGNSGYAASKFGLRGFHEVLRTELAGTGVRATLVSPGPVDTGMWDAVNPDERPGFTPRSEMLQADAVAAAVLYAIEQPRDVNVDEVRLSRT